MSINPKKGFRKHAVFPYTDDFQNERGDPSILQRSWLNLVTN